MPNILPVTELQRNGAALVDLAIKDEEPIYLTKHGRAAVVVMSAKEYENLISIKEDIFQREMKIHDACIQGMKEIDNGESVSWSQFKKTLAHKSNSKQGVQ